MALKILITASVASHILSFHLPYLRAFHARGDTVHVACAHAPDHIPGADRVIPLPFRKSMGSPANFRAAALLRALIREENYDLVITHTSLAAFFTRLAVKGLKKRPRVINVAHGYLFDDATPPLKRQILLGAEKLTAPETDLLLTMNAWDDALARLEKLGSRIAFIPGMGVDFAALDKGRADRASYGVPEDAFLLVYAAEFSARKSQETLLRAMALLPENVYLVLAGEGTTKDAMMVLANDLGLSDRVRFPGYVSPIGPLYAAADAAVSPSRSEGLPFNIMEAMYHALPVAASCVKGHTDLIRDGETGLLFPYGDPEACAEDIRQLLADPEKREALGAAAHESVLRYDLERVLPEVMALYDSAV